MNYSRSEDQQSVVSDYRTDGRGPVAGGTLVGLTTEDGALMAADTRTSGGAVVRSEGIRKISQIHPTAVMGSTDDLGTVQLFVRAIRSEADRYETSHDEPMDMTALSTVAVTELRERSLPDTTFLLGGVDADALRDVLTDLAGSGVGIRREERRGVLRGVRTIDAGVRTQATVPPRQ